MTEFEKTIGRMLAALLGRWTPAEAGEGYWNEVARIKINLERGLDPALRLSDQLTLGRIFEWALAIRNLQLSAV
jgi:hypothetical protein